MFSINKSKEKPASPSTVSLLAFLLMKASAMNPGSRVKKSFACTWELLRGGEGQRWHLGFQGLRLKEPLVLSNQQQLISHWMIGLAPHWRVGGFGGTFYGVNIFPRIRNRAKCCVFGKVCRADTPWCLLSELMYCIPFGESLLISSLIPAPRSHLY